MLSEVGSEITNPYILIKDPLLLSTLFSVQLAKLTSVQFYEKWVVYFMVDIVIHDVVIVWSAADAEKLSSNIGNISVFRVHQGANLFLNTFKVWTVFFGFLIVNFVALFPRGLDITFRVVDQMVHWVLGIVFWVNYFLDILPLCD